MPASGINAVEAMVEVLHACRTIELRSISHPQLNASTIAIGTTISGGAQ